MKYNKFYFTVTPFSKALALLLFFLLPVAAFIFGIYVGQATILGDIVSRIDSETVIQSLPVRGR